LSLSLPAEEVEWVSNWEGQW